MDIARAPYDFHLKSAETLRFPFDHPTISARFDPERQRKPELKFVRYPYFVAHGHLRRLKIVGAIADQKNRTMNLSLSKITTDNHVVLFTYKPLNDR